MKTMSVALLIVVFASTLFAQDATSSEWQIMPSVALLKFFPGDQTNGGYVQPMIYPPIGSYSFGGFNNYAGTGLSISARCFNEEFKPLALTFGGGVNWFYDASDAFAIPAAFSSTNMGVRQVLRGRSFNTYPFNAGVQVVFPYATRDRLMFFAGLEGNLHFISGNIAMNEQAKFGYTVLGGFAVSVFEFGIRYMEFSDMRNFGAQLGLRFKSFGL
jgi:hypothetical protein